MEIVNNNFIERSNSSSSKSKTISLRQLFVFLGLFSFLRPTIFEKFEATNLLFNGLLVISLIFVVADFVIQYGLSRFIRDKFLLVSILYYSLMIVSTVLNNESIQRMLMYVFVGFSSIVFAKYVFEKELLFASSVMKVLVWLYAFINIISIIAFPDGIVKTGSSGGSVFFLGQYSRFAFFFFPALLFCVLGDIKKYKKIRINTIFLLIICFFSVILSGTVGSSLAMIIMFLLMIIGRKKKINFVILFVIYIIFYLALTYFSITNYFAKFVEDVLKRDLTLSSRTLIWNHGFNYIHLSPYYGVGIMDNVTMLENFNFVHLHNHLLQVTFNTGYIGLTLFIILLFISFLSVTKHRDNYISILIGVFVLCTGIELLVDCADGVRNHFIFLMAVGSSAGLTYKTNRKRHI